MNDFGPLTQGGSTRNMALIGSVASEEIFEMLTDNRTSVILINGQRKTLSFSSITFSSAHLVDHTYQTLHLRINQFLRIFIQKHNIP